MCIGYTVMILIVFIPSHPDAPECEEPANVTVSVSPDEEVTLDCRVDSSLDKVPG